MDKSVPIGLSDTLRALRAELAASLRAGIDEAIRFRINLIELELSIGFRKDSVNNADIKAWVLSLGVNSEVENHTMQKIKIQMEVIGPDKENLSVVRKPNNNP